MKNIYRIVAKNGHYEVFNERNEFILSGDTYSECEQELEELTNDGFAA
ncbi:MAG: hypothetical protein IJN96_05825 [Clostridia bacterium]|nr:hypothetical protein [Clostridia bacterium]